MISSLNSLDSMNTMIQAILAITVCCLPLWILVCTAFLAFFLKKK
jgi:hypothetical protein